MIDKTIPYVKFQMERNTTQALPDRQLPEGYQVSFYTPGDERDWQVIETSVGEFDHLSEAQGYFQKNFVPYPDELEKRMTFVTDPSGKKVATCTAWWAKEGGPQFHWLAVMREAQRKGIATFLTVKVTALLEELYPDQPAMLHTQTWNYPAITIYQKLGYTFVSGTKDFEKGMSILKDIVRRED
ncbi:GNAT family N-acetyltransferase [Tetragenococcus halophilus]|uniref:GNAT family N-acetyltransferase n=1 Tax=Tetragenococcus halophilus TaxID=51669 RepID=UPI001B7A2B6F|nr:GNAT family N-acetyltransferase [Tetragenococcus halophilus]GFK28320.1 N-acetyltransferase [Tetragenococcus halophilus]